MRLSALLLGLLAPASLHAQADPSAIAVRQIALSGPTAEWLARYDRVAWISSDSVMAQPASVLQDLGPEWFADTINGLWHAFYGRYTPDNDSYVIALHYAGDRPATLRSVTTPVDSARVRATARALYRTRVRLPASLTPPGLRLNWYARRSASDSLEIWVLPAFQESGFLVFGGEAVYRWNARGTTLRDSTLVVDGYRTVRPDTTREVVIPAESTDYPTPGNLFFLLAYHSYFRKLYVRSRLTMTTLYDGPEGPAFISAVRDSLSPR